jgi:processive 1,2-diacylglycerol beta-glucosyltransferase
MAGAEQTLLVLTSATGAGHDTHAAAAREWCARLFGGRVRVRIAHILEESHPLCRAGVEFYNMIQRRAPWAHHLYYNLLELPGMPGSSSVGPGRAHVERVLREAAPAAVLSVHDCLNRGHFALARRMAGPGAGPRCATFCAEFGGGYGFSRNWVDPAADFFFARTEEAGAAAVGLGLPTERVLRAGHWAPPAFYGPPMEPEARTAFVGRELGLESGRFTLLLSTGGAGAQNHAALLRALRPLAGGIQVVALCGRDEHGRRWLEAGAAREVGFPVRVLGFSGEMVRLLDACDAVVARAGATTAGEALLRGCPVVFNALGGMMPQELPTWRWFRDRALGARIFRPEGLASVVRRWLEDPSAHKRLKEAMARHRDTTPPEAALRRLLE